MELWRSRAALDALVGVLFAVFVVAVSAQLDATGSERSYDAVAFACIAVAAVAVAARRASPLSMLLVVTLALSVYIAREYPGGPIFVAVFIVLYTCSVQRSRVVTTLAGSASILAIVVTGVAFGGTGVSLVQVAVVGWAFAAVVLGELSAGRDEERAALKQRALELERTREAEGARRVAEDRVRMAREVHDSVSHSLASIALQSGVALHLGGSDDAATDALRAIRETSTEAMRDLKNTLGLLRDPRSVDSTAITSLTELVESARRGGLAVALHGDIDRGDLDPGGRVVRLAVIGEALDNAARHAPRSHVAVTTRRCGGSIEVEVVNTATPKPHQASTSMGTGFGLVGLEERVREVGGEVSFGPLDDGGYRVVARFPSAGDES